MPYTAEDLAEIAAYEAEYDTLKIRQLAEAVEEDIVLTPEPKEQDK